MLEEKIETLTKEVVALRQAIEANGTGAKAGDAAKKPATKGKAAADDDDDDDDKTAAKGKAPAKGKTAAKGKAKAEPEHDEDEVGAMFRKAAKKDKPKCKKFLAKKDCEDLAELLTKPELFDEAYDFAEAIVEAPEDDEDDD